MAEQTEKAFLKQPKVFLCSKKSGKGKRPGKGGNRFWKSIGLAFKTPREARSFFVLFCLAANEWSMVILNIEFIPVIPCAIYGLEWIYCTYIDKKCPFVGNVSIRGRILAGTCHSAKMMRTIIVRRNYILDIQTLQHMYPHFRVKEGDHVIIGQCRPLSKTVRFNVLKVIPAGSSGAGKKAFTGI
ncbi:hypothetical protein I3843_Q028200 [Carya illinoinensis]|nr:hypothetical protein I3843_Q028200 [Carya illinoinensis]